MDSPRRRALLGVVGLAAVGANAGCLQTDRSDSGTETSPQPATSAETSATTDETRHTKTESTDRGETESTATTRRSKRTDDLFLANRLSDDQLLYVRVTRRPASAPTEGDGTGERLLSRRYEVPAGATLELSNLVVAENTYTVETRLPGDEWQEFAWAVLNCAEYGTATQEPRTPEEDPTLNTDAMVQIGDAGIELLRNECDAIAFSRDMAPPASEHVVQDSLGTTTE